MKPLLATSSPLYLKRLSRELNALGDGFYAKNLRGEVTRFSRACYRGGALYAVFPIDRELCDITGQTPHDAYGRTVCASRTP